MDASKNPSKKKQGLNHKEKGLLYVVHDKPAPTSLAIRAAKAFLLLPGINQDLLLRSK